LEITLLGPTLRFEEPAVIALTGADLGARLNHDPIALWTPVRVAPGDELSFVPPGGTGARAYLCVTGGLDVAPVLGSRSTDLVGHFGGYHGRPLQPGDVIAIGSPSMSLDRLLRRRLAFPPPAYEAALTARVTLGPQQDRFTEEGLATFLSQVYRVSAKADRTGVRLEGPRITHRNRADLVSEGIANGAVQVPGDGQPIVLLAARQTVGGYVKIATVIGADLDRLAQARPGDRVTFHEVSPEAAREATLAYLERLGPEAIIEEKLIVTGMSTRTDVTAAIDALSADSMWDPEGVERVIRAAEAAGVTTLRLSIASIGLTLELSRGPQAIVPPETSSPAASSLQTPESLITVTAPVLGVFYRRNGPDQPLLASEGEPVEEGQLLGLIEVMKTYHEVRAPQAGVLERFLVNDGQFVEYGQPVVQLSAA
jgi:biotin-dependent carboxylase-like uncharacterized protein